MIRIGALLLTVTALTACGGGRDASTVAMSGQRDGLSLRARLSAHGDTLVVDTVVRNDRAGTIYLDADQCGRVTEAVLARTKFEPVGRTWSGSLQAAKRHVVKDQESRQWPDGFAPRIPGKTSSETPPCVRPERPRALRPGQEIAERWELPPGHAYGLAAVGSAASVVRVEAVEAKAPDELHFLDILPSGAAEEARAGRNVLVERPVSSVLDRAPTDPVHGPSLAQLFDRMVQDSALRRWIETQPADGWRLVDLEPSYPSEGLRLHLVTTGYERAAVATARPDGTGVSVRLPTATDRARVFPRRPATLPAGIRVIPEKDGYEPTQDVLPGSLELPSGRVVVTELLDDKPLDLRVKPGRYAAYATLATYEQKFESVALATLILSPAPTVRWRRIGVVGVDGGTAGFYSPESADLMRRERDPDEPDNVLDRVFDSQAAHDYLITEYGLAPGRNLIQFSSGNGDGGYPILAGYDAAGQPTRIVVDFYLLHLDWPGSS